MSFDTSFQLPSISRHIDFMYVGNPKFLNVDVSVNPSLDWFSLWFSL